MPGVSGTPTIGTLYQPTAAEQQNVSGANGMEMDDFYKLLAAQMQYQNPEEPMDTSAMMASMLQAQVIQSLSSVTNAVMQMQFASATTYAASLHGQEVKVAKTDKFGQPTGEYITGKVTGVILGQNPLIIVNNESYQLNQIVGVGQVPDKPTDKPADPNKPVDPNKPAEKPENKPVDPEKPAEKPDVGPEVKPEDKPEAKPEATVGKLL